MPDSTLILPILFFFLLASVLDVKIKDCVIKKYKTLFTFFEKENFNASVARGCAAKLDDFSELRKINLIDSYCTVQYVLKFAKMYQPNMQHILYFKFFFNLYISLNAVQCKAGVC